MKVFLDTNILLDLLLEREGFEDSAELFRLQEDGRLKLYVSYLTMVNIAYVYRKTVGQNMAVANLKYLSALVEVLPMDGGQLQKALMMSGPDIEDIFQLTCAVAGGKERKGFPDKERAWTGGQDACRRDSVRTAHSNPGILAFLIHFL